MSKVVKLEGLGKLTAAGLERAGRFEKANQGATALVLGPTGEVGREVVRLLLETGGYKRVVVLTRRDIEYEGPNRARLEQVKVDYGRLGELQGAFQGHESCFCCLGTTRGKSGKEGFIKLDHDYVLEAAGLAKSEGTRQFLVCSAANANSSSMFLYPRVKGQVEEALKELKFDRLGIFQPGFLECAREESRLGERVASYAVAPLKWLFPKHVAVPTLSVGKAMVFSSFDPVENAQQVTQFSNAQIIDYAAAI